MPYMSVDRYCLLGAETTRGTAATTFTALPVDPNPKLTTNLTWLKDEALRGSPVDQYDDVPSVDYDDYAPKGLVFLDTFPTLLAAIFGPDVLTGTAAPYTHTFGLAHDAATGDQPGSFTVVDVDNIAQTSFGGGAAKQFVAGQLDELSITFSADGALEYSTKFVGNPFTEITVPTGYTWSTSVLVPAWNGTLTLGGTEVEVLMSGSVDIKRGTKPIFTVAATQSPYRLWAGPIAVTGKVTFVAEADDPTFLNALTRSHQTAVLTFTEPVSSDTLALTMSSFQLKNPQVDGSKEWEQITADFVANADTTDATNGGYSPIQAVVNNSQQTTY